MPEPEQSLDVICPKCGGVGIIEGSWEYCEVCRGKGHLKLPSANPRTAPNRHPAGLGRAADRKEAESLGGGD